MSCEYVWRKCCHHTRAVPGAGGEEDDALHGVAGVREPGDGVAPRRGLGAHGSVEIRRGEYETNDFM